MTQVLKEELLSQMNAQLLAVSEQFSCNTDAGVTGVGLTLTHANGTVSFLSLDKDTSAVSTPLSMAAGVLLACLESESDPQVHALVLQTLQLCNAAVEVKTSKSCQTHTVH